jgi:hypothetical protein
MGMNRVPRATRASFAMPPSDPPSGESRLPVLLEGLACPRCLGLKGSGIPSKGTWKPCPECQGSGYKPGVAKLCRDERSGATWWEVDLAGLGVETHEEEL